MKRNILAELSYDPDSGEIRNAEGKLVGCVSTSGYRMIKFSGKGIPAHRVAWKLFHGEWPKDQIDHINGIKDDNRLCNLRESSQVENTRNRKLYKNNTTGFKGVLLQPDKVKFYAKVCKGGRNFYSYGHTSAKSAAKAYDELAKKHFGEFASLNLPEECQ